jgi:hypothetical protein
VIALKAESRTPLSTTLIFSVPCLAAAFGWHLALRCLRFLLFKVRLQRGEKRAHGAGLILEQKQTKETEISVELQVGHCVFGLFLLSCLPHAV